METTMKSFWTKVLVLTMAMVLLCSSVACASKQTDVVKDGDLAYYPLQNGTWGVGVAEEKRESVTAVVIPATYQGKAVSFVVRQGFADCVKLKSVSLPGSVEMLGDFAFADCGELNTVTLGVRLCTIGRYAFSGCSSLESVTIPNSVSTIGDYAFAFCGDLKSVALPTSLQHVSENLFYKCRALESVTVPDNVKTIGKYAFWDCGKLAVVSVGRGVEEIDVSAFRGCGALSAIHVAAENGKYHSTDGILYNKPVNTILYVPAVLTGEITIPDGVMAIDSSAFAGQTGITSLKLPKSLTTIGGSAFSGCDNLISVTFAETKGWKSGDVSINSTLLSDVSTAARFLTYQYVYDAWKKSA